MVIQVYLATAAIQASLVIQVTQVFLVTRALLDSVAIQVYLASVDIQATQVQVADLATVVTQV